MGTDVGKGGALLELPGGSNLSLYKNSALSGQKCDRLRVQIREKPFSKLVLIQFCGPMRIHLGAVSDNGATRCRGVLHHLEVKAAFSLLYKVLSQRNRTRPNRQQLRKLRNSALQMPL